jgi:hypothetical protein
MQWVVNTIYSMLRWRAFPPRYIFRLALEMARQSAAVLQSASTPDGYAVWSELQNKIEAFSLFEYADSELGVAGNPGVPLHELVSRAFQLGPYRSVWAMEGLGYCYAGLHSHGGLFCEDKTSRLPAASLVPLHTGMGLAFAQRVLESMSGNQSRDFTLLDKFAQLCRDNSQNGYAGAAFEALGLVTRNLYPHLVPVVDAYLSQSEVFLAYFWHGIGRGIYFNPVNLLPFCGAPWNAVEMCRLEPQHEIGRHNAVAGMAWALTLVNIRQPEILATFLRYRGRDAACDEAFANGMRSGLAVWRMASPDDHYLDVLRSYVPDNANASLAALWDRCVTQSCQQALSYQRAPGPETAVSDYFRYRHSSAFST